MIIKVEETKTLNLFLVLEEAKSKGCCGLVMDVETVTSKSHPGHIMKGLTSIFNWAAMWSLGSPELEEMCLAIALSP